MSDLIDTSGAPVYPRDGFPPKARAEQSLISRREWFITHAPEVPSWFRYEGGLPPPNPDELVPEDELDAAQQAELVAWVTGDATDFEKLSPPVRQFMLRREKVQNLRRVFAAWHLKRREEKWWAWASYFADRMTKDDHGK